MAGTYTTAQTVAISCATTGTVIRYTTDGTTPKENSAIYTTPITLSSDAEVKAYASSAGVGDSEVADIVYKIYQKGAPTSLTAAAITDTTFTLNWKAAIDGAGVVSYDIYKDAQLVGSTTAGAITLNVTGLTTNTTYKFTVNAKNAASNIIAVSNPLTVRTAGVNADLVITDIDYTPSSPSEGDEVIFSATIKNIGTAATPGTVKNKIEFSLDGGSPFVWVDNFTRALSPGQSVTLRVNRGLLNTKVKKCG